MSWTVKIYVLIVFLFKESFQQTTDSVLLTVDGGWSSWADSNPCSVTCGSGSIFRLRTCTNPAPQNGGKTCEGLPFERHACNKGPCPVDGGWSPWKPFSACSATCGKAFHTSTRLCNKPAPLNGGKPCVGNASDTQLCRDLPLCAIDGQWSNWSAYSECSVNCGHGTKNRTRVCNNPAPKYGGLDCAGNASEVIGCSAKQCPVDGGWSAWVTAGSGCSVTCGRGSKIRIRTCSNPAPVNGGRDCPGAVYDSTSCLLKECPVNGGWTRWSPFTPCTTTCGVGYQTSTRTCTNPSPQFGGQPCTGNNNDTRVCPNQPLCPVDGGWSPWKPYSSCSATCGFGSQTSTRECNSPAPENGGKPCEGNTTNTRPCTDLSPCETTILTTLSTRKPEATKPSTQTTETSERQTTAIETLPTETSTVSSTTMSSSGLLTTDITTRTESVTSQEQIVTTTAQTETSHMSVSQVTHVTYPETSFITSETRVSEFTTVSTILPTTSKSSEEFNKPKLGMVVVSFAVYIDKNFDDKLLDPSSTTYKETGKMVLEVLTERFKNTPGFLMVVINGFSYGSIRVNYTVGLSGEALSTDDKVRAVKDHLLSKATKWTPNEPVFSGFPVNTVKTNTDASKQDISAVLSTERKAACACPLDGYFCDFREGGAMCVNQCTGFRCGPHGSCLVDADTKLPKCYCKQFKNSKLVYYGDKCEKTKELDSVEPIGGESDNLTLIGVTAGVGGGLFLFITVAVICVCRKIHEQKKQLKSTVSYSNQSSLCHLDQLEHNKGAKENFYSKATHNPLYQDNNDVRASTNAEQIVRIFLHVEPEKSRGMSMHSVGSIRTSRSGEDPHVYMIGDRTDLETHNFQSTEKQSRTPLEDEAETYNVHNESS